LLECIIRSYSKPHLFRFFLSQASKLFDAVEVLS